MRKYILVPYKQYKNQTGEAGGHSIEINSNEKPTPASITPVKLATPDSEVNTTAETQSPPDDHSTEHEIKDAAPTTPLPPKSTKLVTSSSTSVRPKPSKRLSIKKPNRKQGSLKRPVHNAVSYGSTHQPGPIKRQAKFWISN